MKSVKKVLLFALAVAMGTLMAISSPLTIFAEGQKKYVESIVVVNGKDYSEALKKLDEKGKADGKTYYPANREFSMDLTARRASVTMSTSNNLLVNTYAATKKRDGKQETEEEKEEDTNYVLVGYSVTTDKQDAVTDIAAMNMCGNFDGSDEYDKLLKDEKDRIHETVQQMYPAFRLFGDKVEDALDSEEDSLTLFAYEMLNKFYNDDITDETGAPVTMAKMLTHIDDYTTDQVDDLFMQMSGLAFTTIEKYVFLGCMENWVENMLTLNDDTQYQAVDTEKAQAILRLMPEFQEQYNKYKEANVTLKSSEETVKQYLNGLSSDADKATFMKYATADAGISDATMKDGTPLLDIFMQDTSGEDVVSSLLPIAYCIPDELSCLVGITDLADLFFYAIAVDEDLTELRAEASLDTMSQYSVYAGVDRSIYNSSGIAVTNRAKSEMQSSNAKLYNQLKKDEKTLLGLEIATGIIGGLCFTVGLYCAVRGGIYISMAKSTNIAVVSKTSALSTVQYLNLVGGVFIAVAVVLLVTFCVLLAITLAKKAAVAKEKAELLKIPRIIVDYYTDSDGKNKMIYYYCAKDEHGEEADLNAGYGEQWSALYYTKDADVGNPLTTDTVKATMNDSNAVLKTDVFTPVHEFASYVPYNLNSYNGHRSSTALYLGFSCDTTPKQADPEKTLPGATSIVKGTSAIYAAGGAVIGAAIALGISAIIRKKKAKASE